MMGDKWRRKIDDVCWQEEWSFKYFLIKSAEKAGCVICNEILAVLKEYNLRRHYQSKHQSNCSQLEGKVRAEKLANLQHQIIVQRSLFTKSSNENESLTKASYKVAYVLAKHGKPFTHSEIIKDCLLGVAEELCSEKMKTLQEFLWVQKLLPVVLGAWVKI